MTHGIKCRRSSNSPGAKLRGKHAKSAHAAGADKATKHRHTAAGKSTAAAPATATEHSADSARPVNAGQTAASAALLRIDGRADGSIQYAGTIHIGPQAQVLGPLRAQNIIVEGEIAGDLHADVAIRLAATARVRGNLMAPRISVVRGAQLQGRMTTVEHAAADNELSEAAVEGLMNGTSHS